MKRVLPLILVACMVLLCACTSGQVTADGSASDAAQIFSNSAETYSDSHQLLSIKGETPENVQSAAPVQEEVASAPSDGWWERSEGFSKFPRYAYGGEIAKGYEDGAVTAEKGTEQYLLKNVDYLDYKSYVDELLLQGYRLYDPYGGFVEQTDLELSAVYGSAVFEKGNSRLYIEYNLYSSTLRMEVLTDQNLS